MALPSTALDDVKVETAVVETAVAETAPLRETSAVTLDNDRNNTANRGPTLASEGAAEEFLASLSKDILGEALYSGEQLAAGAHTTVDELEMLWMELGFAPKDPEVVYFTQSDADALMTLNDLRAADLVTPEVTATMSRVLGQALARMAAAQAQAFYPIIVERINSRSNGLTTPRSDALPGTEDPNEMIRDVFVPVFERFIGYIWRRHLVSASTRVLLPPKVEAVGFADLVDYTKMTVQTAPGQLAEMIGRFHHIVNNQVSANQGRVVKLIGDAVLYVTEEPAPAVAIALAIQQACKDDPDLPAVRAGVASGDLVDVEGDIFGTTVNLASRLAEMARPGSILVDDETAGALMSDYRFDFRALRPRRLKGLGFVRGWVTRSTGQT